MTTIPRIGLGISSFPTTCPLPKWCCWTVCAAAPTTRLDWKGRLTRSVSLKLMRVSSTAPKCTCAKAPLGKKRTHHKSDTAI